MSRVSGRGLLLIVVSVVVAVVAVAGFLMMGAPDQTRLHRIDERRTEELQSIAIAIETHYANGKRLPDQLSDLRPVPGDAQPWRDPASGQPYEYRVLGGSRYELCATFSLASEEGDVRSSQWAHGAGRQCFELDATHPYAPKPAPAIVPEPAPDTSTSGP